MLKAAVFGSGLMGSALARDLVGSRNIEQVSVFDVDRKRLRGLTRIESSDKLTVRRHDVRRVAETSRVLKDFDVGIGALPHSLSKYAIDSALRSRTNFVDLIFGWRFKTGRVNSQAVKNGITIVPACGLAPGLTNLLAKSAVDELETVDEVHLKVGGIPEKPKPPLNYRVVFSFEAVLEEYMRKAQIIKNGRVVEVPALSGFEQVAFPSPVGKCECFYTDGLSTLIQTIRGVGEMDEKTIRWPGHVDQIKTLVECGLLETSPIRFNKMLVEPREFVGKVLNDKLALRNERDLTLLRVDVAGLKDGRRIHRRFEMIDHYDSERKMTSMARTTAFPCAIAAQLLGSGQVKKTGLVPPELAFDKMLRGKIRQYLTDRRIMITGWKD